MIWPRVSRNIALIIAFTEHQPYLEYSQDLGFNSSYIKVVT